MDRGHCRVRPPITRDEEIADQGLNMIDEAVGETENELGYA